MAPEITSKVKIQMTVGQVIFAVITLSAIIGSWYDLKSQVRQQAIALASADALQVQRIAELESGQAELRQTVYRMLNMGYHPQPYKRRITE